MMTLDELRAIIKREWKTANPTQRMVLAKKMNELNPSMRNAKALETAKQNLLISEPTYKHKSDSKANYSKKTKSNYSPFRSPLDEGLPKFLRAYKGGFIAIPYDKSIPLNYNYLEDKNPCEYQTIYEENKEGLIWLSSIPFYPAQYRAFRSEKGTDYFRHISTFEELKVKNPL